LVRAWAEGWAISRGAPAPVEVPEGYRIDVSLPGHLKRYVLPEHAPALARRLTEPGTWLKICGDGLDLDPRWEVQAPEYLMTTRLTSDPPGDVEILERGQVIDAIITRDGEPAARGRAALAGDYAVMDQVVTEDAHRRQGLGTTVMQALAAAATARGAATGVLVATADGLALYSRLGWELASPITAARLSGPGSLESPRDRPRE
jgi:GNAT superfamily N-acetyltransferase